MTSDELRAAELAVIEAARVWRDWYRDDQDHCSPAENKLARAFYALERAQSAARDAAPPPSPDARIRELVKDLTYPQLEGLADRAEALEAKLIDITGGLHNAIDRVEKRLEAVEDESAWTRRPPTTDVDAATERELTARVGGAPLTAATAAREEAGSSATPTAKQRATRCLHLFVDDKTSWADTLEEVACEFSEAESAAEARGREAGIREAIESAYNAAAVKPPDGSSIVWLDGFTSGTWLARSAIRALLRPAPAGEEKT